MTTAAQPALFKRFLALVYEGLIFLAVTIVAIIVALPVSYVLKAQPLLQQIVLTLWFLPLGGCMPNSIGKKAKP